MKRKLIILIFFLFLILLYICNIDNIPSEIILLKDEELNLKTLVGITLEEEAYIETSNEIDNCITKKIDVNVCGVTLKKIMVTELPEIKVVPVGKVVGLKLYTDGILVVGVEEEFELENSNIKEGDTLISVNNTTVDSIDTLKEIINNSEGENLEVEYTRDGINILTSTIKATKNENNEYKLGLWVKEGATGVGTMSFYIPETKQYIALGHGVYDNDTDTLLNIKSGEVLTSKIISIVKGEYNTPGEIKGTIKGESTIGTIEENTEFGIYGYLEDTESLEISEDDLTGIASRNEIDLGEAYLLCSLDNEETKQYTIEIESIDVDNDNNNRSMMIKITDEELLEETGGIICGMSGCPIMQNGKLVGVVTNVLVTSPDIGYAVFADLMIKELVSSN